MTIIGQVAHIVRKDATRLRWWLVAYLLLTLTVTWSVKTWWLDADSRALAPVALWALAGFIVVLLVHADAPGNSNAFWASKAISPTSLLGAKLSVVFGYLVAVPLIGEGIALRPYVANGNELAAMILPALALFALALLVVVLIASLTRSLPSCIGVVLGVPFAVVLAWTWWNVLLPGTRPTELGAFKLVALGVATSVLALTLVVYRARLSGNRWLALGILPLVVSTLAAVTPRPDTPGPVVGVDDLGGTGLLVDEAGLEWLDVDRAIRVTLTATGPDSAKDYRFAADSIRIEGVNGTSKVVPLYGRTDTPAQSVSKNTPFARARSTGRYFFMFSHDDRERFGGGVRSVRVQGRIDALVPSLVASLPATADTLLSSHNARTRVGVARDQPSSIQLDVEGVASRAFRTAPFLDVWSAYAVRLVWPQATSVPSVKEHAEWTEIPTVLPWILKAGQRMTISVQRPASSTAGPSPSLVDARLEIIRWTVVASYPATADAAVTLPRSSP